MKEINLLVIGFMILLMISCNKDQPEPNYGTGILVVNIDLSVREYKVKKGLKTSVPISDFKVTVYKADDTEVLVFETVSAMPDSIELTPGNYYVEAHSNNNLPAAFDNPYYYGKSKTFSISNNKSESVTVLCSLANTIVSISWSDAVVMNFEDYTAKVSSLLDSLLFVKDESRHGYFIPSPLEILIEMKYQNPDGSEGLRNLAGSIANPLAGRHYEIFVNSGLNFGKGYINVLMDETEIPLEVVEINDAEENIPASEDVIKYGDILITEIMFDPSVLADNEGEWFEIYNNSGRLINLQGLVFDRDGTNKHIVTDSIGLLPGHYYVLSRTANATDAKNSYVYGTSVTLPNTGGVLSIFNKVLNDEQGELIFSVNYGAANFPHPAGASVSLCPGKMNASDAVLGTSWSVSSSVYNTGDLGTPGQVNDPCQ